MQQKKRSAKQKRRKQTHVCKLVRYMLTCFYLYFAAYFVKNEKQIQALVANNKTIFALLPKRPHQCSENYPHYQLKFTIKTYFDSYWQEIPHTHQKSVTDNATYFFMQVCRSPKCWGSDHFDTTPPAAGGDFASCDCDVSL